VKDALDIKYGYDPDWRPIWRRPREED